MSWAAITWIHNLPPDAVDPTGRQILDKLAYRHDEETGECAPGKPWLMFHTGLSERTIKNWLPKLEKQGWFRSERRKAVNGRTDSTQYHLNIGFYLSHSVVFRPADFMGGVAALAGASIAPQGASDTPSVIVSQGADTTPTRGHVVHGGGGISGAKEGAPATPQLQDNYQTTTDKDQEGAAPSADVTAPAAVEAKPGKHEGTGRVVQEIPLATKSDPVFRVRASLAESYVGDFPALNVAAELRACWRWNNDHPTKRKTREGILKHLTWWMREAQNNPRKRATGRDGRLREAAEQALGPKAPDKCTSCGGELKRVRWGKNYAAQVCSRCNPGHPGLAAGKDQPKAAMGVG